MDGNKPTARDDTESVVNAFLAAFNRRDVDRLMALMTDDCVYESAGPAPDGVHLVGQKAVRKAWEQLFQNRPDVVFDGEETFVAGDRAVARWIMLWTADGKQEHIRGLDIFRVESGKIANKLAYVKR
jgi:ketosteroid isomerase-like protein